jgi:hypothetical protein
MLLSSLAAQLSKLAAPGETDYDPFNRTHISTKWSVIRFD